MRADGLGMGWIHFRVNSSQLHNAIRRVIDPNGELDLGSRGALARLRDELAKVQPLRSNFAALAIESSTAIRQFLPTINGPAQVWFNREGTLAFVASQKVSQIDVFRDVAGVTGLVMTKLDGTARGGVLVAAAERHGLPIHAIGIGETMEDLRPFDADEIAGIIAGNIR